MEPSIHETLLRLHNGEWTECLMTGELRWIFTKVLNRQERMVTAMKIDGLVDGEIALMLGVKLGTVKRYKYDIEYKYRNGIGKRIDNHPAIRKQKSGFIVHRKKRRTG